MAKSDDLSTDWQRSAGDFSCTVCHRKRLPASEFSKKQVEKMLASLKSIPDKDVRTGPGMQTVTYLAGVCKQCMEEKEQKEQAEAQAKREEREQAAAEAVIEPPERVEVSFAARPFGITPASKAEGYVVLKTSEGKPAAKAGVRSGWRLVSIAGESCEGLDINDAQAKLKAADLPASLVFEAIPGNADFCTSCQQILAAPLFSRKMRTKPPEKRRCSACVDASAEAEEAEAAAAPQGGYVESGSSSKLSELKQLCAASAVEAEAVTGLKAVRGGSAAGRGRGRGGRR
eukprot:TRINITY_DN34852_c0_g1_i1.p1 TRINITY_DN34852_c0_g1~~TRINITY_DN34852_c0_g1_i1.p1  ORF type:complete len:287 (-),score=90.21 TRINITY_DN34852_c0_g1_i1:46-906(-)